MKRKRLIAVLLAACLLLSACASKTAPVEEMINKIGVVTLDSRSAIEKAEAAYAALSPSEQDKIRSAYAKLQKARAIYDDLERQDVQQRAERVLAEHAQEGDITFNQIPWGVSIDDALAVLQYVSGEPITILHRTQDTRTLADSRGNQHSLIVYTLYVPSLKAGGFPVMSPSTVWGNGHPRSQPPKDTIYSNVTLYFAPEVNADGTAYSTRNGRLFAARYNGLDPAGMMAQELEAEIIGKLDGLYGLHAIGEDDSGRLVCKWESQKAAILLNEEWRHDENYINLYTNGNDFLCTIALTYFGYTDDLLENLDQVRKIDEQRRQEKERKAREKKQKEETERGTDGL